MAVLEDLAAVRDHETVAEVLHDLAARRVVASTLDSREMLVDGRDPVQLAPQAR
jgi:hypothetical protein